MALTGFMLTVGFVSKAVLEADTAKDIGNWTVQTDQYRMWIRPGNEADVINEGEELIKDAVGGMGAYGGASFTWPMVNLSPLMVKYIRDTYFSNGTLFSNDVTARTFNRSTGAWEVYQCTVQRGFARDATQSGGGLTDYRLTFINGVQQV